MSFPTPNDREDVLGQAFTSRAWALLGVFGAAVIGAGYVATHPYPASYGGLFLTVVDSLQTNGYQYPVTVELYGTNGIPFAYPPLMFYANAIFSDLFGVSGMALARYLPPLCFALATVPYYFVATELLGTRVRAGLGAFIYAVTPVAFDWTITGGGIVRAPALVLTFTGFYTGIRLFRDGGRRWLIASTLLFGLTVLSHPVMSVGFAMSYLFFFVAFARSIRGLCRGAAVAIGGLALASPWYLTVISNHGLTPFLAALGILGGVGPTTALPADIWDPFARFFALYHILAVLGAVLLVAERRYVLPGWLFVLWASIARRHLWFVPASMMAAVFAVEFLHYVRNRASRPHGSQHAQRALPAVLIALLVLHGSVTGGVYASDYLDMEHADGMREYLDQEDIEAMVWIERETAPDSRIAVVGGEGEWLPYLADRQSVLAWWGMEWSPPSKRHVIQRAYNDALACPTTECLTSVLSSAGIAADYVYLTRDRIRPFDADWEGLNQTVHRSSQYNVVFQNDQVIVASVENQSS